MAKIKHLFFFFILFNLSAESQQISVGAEQTDKYLDLLKNKRVGVIANHTSLINKVFKVPLFGSSKISHVYANATTGATYGNNKTLLINVLPKNF